MLKQHCNEGGSRYGMREIPPEPSVRDSWQRPVKESQLLSVCPGQGRLLTPPPLIGWPIDWHFGPLHYSPAFLYEFRPSGKNIFSWVVFAVSGNQPCCFVPISLMSDRPLPSLMAGGQKTQWPDFVWIMGPLQKRGRAEHNSWTQFKTSSQESCKLDHSLSAFAI